MPLRYVLAESPIIALRGKRVVKGLHCSLKRLGVFIWGGDVLLSNTVGNPSRVDSTPSVFNEEFAFLRAAINKVQWKVRCGLIEVGMMDLILVRR
jgi:hypothetical protein